LATTVSFTLNGQKTSVSTDPKRVLLDVLREDLHLTGTKYGCGEARCGACSVLVNGKRQFSCRMAVAEAEGKTLLTIEGLAAGEKLHPVQEAFLAEGVFQCGYCAPGMILATVGLLDGTPRPSDEQILTALNMNLCRCCAYSRILKAVRRVAAQPAAPAQRGGKAP
jgi:aerobic-type carbon monoxide dehydrogenase small subunit (CoxS/CutS family)